MSDDITNSINMRCVCKKVDEAINRFNFSLEDLFKEKFARYSVNSQLIEPYIKIARIITEQSGFILANYDMFKILSDSDLFELLIEVRAIEREIKEQQ